MNPLSHRNKVVSALGVGAVVVVATVAACSGGGSNNGTPTSGSSDAGASAQASGDGGLPPVVDAGFVSKQPGACPNPTVPIIFAPMYSAFIPGSTAQVFSLPAVTSDGNAATWSLSDPTQGNLQLQSFAANGILIPGVLITVEGTGNDAGQITVFANEGNGVCGASVLNLTQNTEDDWTIGNARYNDGVALHLNRPARGGGGAPTSPPDAGVEEASDGGVDGSLEVGLDAGVDGGLDANFEGGFGGFDGGFARMPLQADAGSYYETDGGTACTNCHGPTATKGPYKTVSHTPEQTGGFSDTDLQNIIWNGIVPDGGYFDPTVLVTNCDGGPTCTAQARALWHSFHRWTDITSDELPGVICYLRSLTPEAQTGAANFGGFAGRRRDGGLAP